MPFKDRLAQAWRRLRGGALSPGRAALSVAVGVFVGCLPIYGLQLGLVLALCVPLRLDVAVAYVAAHVSNPLTIVPLLALEVAIGALILTGHAEVPDLEALRHGLSRVGLHAAVGSLVLGATLSAVAAAVTWTLGRKVRDARRAELTRGRRLTLARYQDAPPAARHYVSSKLALDPAIAALWSLEGSFGRVVDAGSGHGHVGLALADLGRLTTLRGFDADPRRVAIARRAAPEWTFDVARLEDARFDEADTVLLVDTLHYLPRPAQDTVLERATRALAPGGRLIVREVDVNGSLQSRLTRWSERRAVRQASPGADAAFRGKQDLTTALEALGLTTMVVENDDFSLFDDYLVVGTKPPAPGAGPAQLL